MEKIDILLLIASVGFTALISVMICMCISLRKPICTNDTLDEKLTNTNRDVWRLQGAVFGIKEENQDKRSL